MTKKLKNDCVIILGGYFLNRALVQKPAGGRSMFKSINSYFRNSMGSLLLKTSSSDLTYVQKILPRPQFGEPKSCPLYAKSFEHCKSITSSSTGCEILSSRVKESVNTISKGSGFTKISDTFMLHLSLLSN